MNAWFRRTVFLSFAALWSVSAAGADPLVFFLMSAAREIITAAIAAQPAPPALPEAAKTYPGTAVVPAELRRVIDESFVYLSSSQRTEVFDSLHALLLDPKIGATRAALIEYFMHKALAVRVAQIQLERLSYADKQRLALQFRQEVAELPAQERRQLLELLQKGLLPVPADLNSLLLAELQ